MISELVDGSAWICPPVDGPAEGVTGLVAAALRPVDCPVLAPCGSPVCRPGLVARLAVLPRLLLLLPVPEAPVPLLMAARSTSASFTASAFLR